VLWPDRSTRWARPLFLASVSAGFPSPAEDYIEGRLDLNRHLIKHPAATFFVRVAGDSMIGAGIHPGDILVVDRALEPQHSNVVIAVIDGELTVKRISQRGGKIFLVPDNQAYEPLEILEEMEFEVWGVVTSVIHNL
jgi:DNA polymerase V